MVIMKLHSVKSCWASWGYPEYEREILFMGDGDKEKFEHDVLTSLKETVEHIGNDKLSFDQLMEHPFFKQKMEEKGWTIVEFETEEMCFDPYKQIGEILREKEII